MRKFLISTIERRAGANFNLKDVGGRNVIANMTINSSTARHEAWISEADFLKFSKDLALLGRTPGCAVHVLKIEEDIPKTPSFQQFCYGYHLFQDSHSLPEDATDAMRAGYALAKAEVSVSEAPKISVNLTTCIEYDVKLAQTMRRINGDESAKSEPTEIDALVKIPYLKLKSIAKTEGVSLECLDKGSRALAGRILAHRKNTVAA